MNSGQRLLQSNGERLSEPIVVGKDILELVSSSMYLDPLTIFREYVQNAVDSIDEAAELGAYLGKQTPRIDITLDAENRRIKIRDNGLGIKRAKLTRTMTAFGASRKRGTDARGFRGVGRLSGLGYCKRVIFRTRHIEESRISEIRWDCEKLKALLRDSSYVGSLNDLVQEIVSVDWHEEGEYSPHFFEVELQEPVRIKSDLLLNEEAVYQYLSQVGPVPFSPDFAFGSEIVRYLREFGVGTSYNIYINGSETPIYRPFRDNFDARLGVVDSFEKFDRVEIEGTTGGIAAVGWILHHGYKGALPSGIGIKGLRLRKGNIQIGGDSILDEAFDEPRFNSWCVAEFHVLGKNLIPNGRRDSFDLNRDYQDLVGKLKPKAVVLSRLCRNKSKERNSSEGAPAKITPKQEAKLKQFTGLRFKAYWDVVEVLYELKGKDAEALVTSLLAKLCKLDPRKD